MSKINYSNDALEYIAKIADGGMRDAITLMDKCLSYSTDLTLENVIKALDIPSYETMFKLNDAIFDNKQDSMIQIIEDVHASGVDIKQFVKNYMLFLLDITKYDILGNYTYINIPETYNDLRDYGSYEFATCYKLLDTVIQLTNNIKWETNPKPVVEASLLMFMFKEKD